MKIRNFVYVDEEPVDVSMFTEEEKEKITINLNVQAAKEMGYERTA